MNYYDRLCDINLIVSCAKKVKSSKSTIKRKYSKGIDDISIENFLNDKDFNKNINKLAQNLRDGTFHFSKLKGTAIPKDNGLKYRLITSPIIPDRIVHRAILAIISPVVFDYINTGSSYCGVKRNYLSKSKNGLNAPKAIKKSISHIKSGKFYMYKTDIEKFFDKVPKHLILEKVEEILYPDNSLMPLFREVVNYELGNRRQLESGGLVKLPDDVLGISQGSSLSPMLANIYLADFDRAIRAKFGDIMIRYVDDILFFADSIDSIREIKLFADEFISSIKLNFNPSIDKTRVLYLRDEAVNFLGLKINRHGIIEKDFSEINEYLIKEVFNFSDERYKYIDTVALKVKNMNQCIAGIFNYYKHYHTKRLVERINKCIEIQRKVHADYSGLELLDISRLSPLVSQSEWQGYFR